MNAKLRKIILAAFQELETAYEEERECLDNQEERFGETERWQEADEICSDFESAIDELRAVLERWDIM